jgi:iron complex transport system substrate-binding protein
MKNWLLILGIVLCSISCTESDLNSTNDQKPIASDSKIISLSGNISEILCALGAEDNLVGVDVTSTFPISLANIPNIGHISQLSIEGIISLEPTVIIGFKDELSQEDIDQFRNLDIQVNLLSKPSLIPEGTNLIKEIGNCINAKEQAESLALKVNKDLEKFESLNSKKKVLFIYARGLGTLMVAGTATVQHEIIEAVGYTNAVDHEGFKTLTAESLVAANPDVILMFESGYESLNSGNELMEIPGIAETNAGMNKSFITMEGSLLSHIGPRIAETLELLKSKLKSIE